LKHRGKEEAEGEGIKRNKISELAAIAMTGKAIPFFKSQLPLFLRVGKMSYQAVSRADC